MSLKDWNTQGKTILVDKPLHWTSFDVVKKLRWHLRQKLEVKKIKVGHAGTLDPLATGLLVICIGKHTKKIDEIQAGVKTYTGKFLLGKTTPSYDLETEYDGDYQIDHITPEMLEEVRNGFLGEQDQIPPVFSAKQIDGKRAYDIARAGGEVVMKAHRIRIEAFAIETQNFPELNFEVRCSKGTYIRSIAHDFGQRLHSGSTLIELRRTASGEFGVEDALSVEEWIEIIENTAV
jgi:tRNA pseudouridine55 synthase